MIKVLWVNFSGSQSSSWNPSARMWDTSLYSSGAGVTVGDLASDNIGESHTLVCNCGACAYTSVDDADIKNTYDHDMDIKNITLHGKTVKFDHFTKDFYAAFFDAVKEKFPDACFTGRNIAINLQNGQLDIEAMMKSMAEKLKAIGYGFTTGLPRVEKVDRFPLQIDEEQRNKFVAWLAEQKTGLQEVERPRVGM